MSYLIVSHEVKDYAKWKPVFDEHGAFRKANGSKGGRLLRNAQDPNRLTILFEWESVDKAQQFAQSPELRAAMEEAGVTGQPQVSFLEEIESFGK